MIYYEILKSFDCDLQLFLTHADRYVELCVMCFRIIGRRKLLDQGQGQENSLIIVIVTLQFTVVYICMYILILNVFKIVLSEYIYS